MLPIEFDRVTIAFLPVGEVKVELVMPTDDTTGVARFLEKKGEGFHHICFEVPDIAEALMRFELDGIELIDTVATEGCRGPGRLPPPAQLPGRARRVDRGSWRSQLGGPRLLTPACRGSLADRPPHPGDEPESTRATASVATAATAWRQIQARPPGSSGPASRNSSTGVSLTRGTQAISSAMAWSVGANGFRPAARDGPIVERMIAGIIRDRMAAR